MLRESFTWKSKQTVRPDSSSAPLGHSEDAPAKGVNSGFFSSLQGRRIR
jgi:hypothetical protein